MAEEEEERRYTIAEVEEILRRAAHAEKGSHEAIALDELLSAAREAGLDPAAVEAAAQEVAEGRSLEQIIARRRQRRRRGFVAHFANFAAVNGMLAVIDVLTIGGPWFQWPLMGWGLGLAIHGVNVLVPPDEEKERRRAERELRREQRERRRSMRERKRAAGGPGEVDQAIKEGLASILGAIADRVGTPRTKGPAHDVRMRVGGTERRPGTEEAERASEETRQRQRRS